MSKQTKIVYRNRWIRCDINGHARRSQTIEKSTKQKQLDEFLNQNDDILQTNSTDKELDDKNNLKLLKLDNLPHYFGKKKEKCNAKYVRCSSLNYEKHSKDKQQKGNSLSQKKKQDDDDKPSDEQLKYIVQPLQIEYMNTFGIQFQEDALQLEALFYQLAKYDFLRHPITSSSPILAYYFFQLLITYKQPDWEKILKQISQDDQTIENINEILRNRGSQQCFLSLIYFLDKSQQIDSVPIKIMKHLQRQVKLLSSQSYFNFQLMLKDFIQYQQLVKMKEQEYYDFFEKDIYEKNNICMGFFRFFFEDDVSKDQIVVRLPIGKFDSDQVINLDLIDRTIFDLFHYTQKYFNIKDAVHSEKILLFWITQHIQEIVNDLKLELNIQLQNYHNSNTNFQAKWQLKKVYLEITSEKKVCTLCVDMFINYPVRILSDDIVAKLNNEIIVSNDFQLIIVTQYLYIPEVKKNERLIQSFKIQTESDGVDKLSNFYFETGYVGLMTDCFLLNRYTMKNNGLFNQEIDTIKLTNTLFLSSEGIDDSNSSSKSLQSSQSQTQNIISNANIFQLLIQTLQNVQWGVKQALIVPYQKGDILQQQAEQCYQLIRIIIDKQIKQDDLPIEISLDFLNLFIRQRIKMLYSPYSDQVGAYLQYFLLKNNKLLNYLSKIDKDLICKSIFDFGNLNTHLILSDFGYFLTNYCNQAFIPLTNQEIKENLNKNNFINFGLVQINLILQDQGQEVLLIQEQQINQNFIIEFIQSYKARQIELEAQGKSVKQIIILFFSIQQLPEDFKKWLEQELNNVKIQFQFYYSFFRKLQTQIYPNEQQYMPYEPIHFLTRYNILNAESQISLPDMDPNILSYLKYFDNKQCEEFHGIVQQTQ